MRIPQTPPPWQPLLHELMQLKEGKFFLAARPTLEDGRYLHWDELRYREPPGGLSLELWWASLQWSRKLNWTPVQEMASNSQLNFGYVLLPQIQAALHEFDRQNVAREILMALGNRDSVTEYRVRQLIEEAINSSVLEGARPTTREMARSLLREQRRPTTQDERMILNNWFAMQRILELRDENRPLGVDDLIELHRILGEDSLEISGAEGVLRTPEHSVVVGDQEGNVWHIPPPAEGLRERLEILLQFAAGEGQGKQPFIHPIIRAILVHFWVGYEHPFRDGNGRIARALFYWCMLKHGYEVAEFLSISGPIDRSPKSYYRAFAFTETDDGDLTYFILHQLQVMRQALTELTAQLKKQTEQSAQLAKLVEQSETLNFRQRSLLLYAFNHPAMSYTIEGHKASHQVHYQTARSDLLALEELGYLSARRVGRGKRYFPTPFLKKSLSKS